MIVHLFPGQGSQHVGMGAELFKRYPQLVEQADEVLGYSIKTLCLEDPRSELSQTQFTQPALFIVNALSYLARIDDGEAQPDFVAGHSLGEYDALFAAGVVDFEQGLRLVQRRGALMSQVRGGGMAAVVGLDEQGVLDVINEESLHHLDLANINSPKQVVVAGAATDIEAAREAFEKRGARYVTLNVSGAFHSRHMQPSSVEFASFVDGMALNAPTIPVIANVTARPYQADAVAKTLVRQISSPVRWCESIQVLMGYGVTDFVEVGPGAVLSGLARQIKRSAKPIYVPESEAAAEVSSSLAEPAGGDDQPERVGVEDLDVLPVVCGAMFRGISGPHFVAAAAESGLVAALGTEGLPLDEVERLVRETTSLLGARPWALAVSPSWYEPDREAALIDIALRHGVTRLEASGYVSVSPVLARFRLKGAYRRDEQVYAPHQVMCKTSRPEVARQFCAPLSASLVQRLVSEARVTAAEAEVASSIAAASSLCADSQGGWLTDHAPATAVLPTFLRLRDQATTVLSHPIPVGLAGGLGSPEAFAAALVMGAEFLMTGSINQCTPEAATSDHVKDLLAACEIQDTTTAPAAAAFELLTPMQVMRRGTLVSARAKRLRDVFERFSSWDEVDELTQDQIERRVLGETFDSARQRAVHAHLLPPDEADPRAVFVGVIRSYLDHCAEAALAGDPEHQVDYLVPTGPAMGAFNSWAAGTDFADWRQRHVGIINRSLYEAAQELLAKGA